MNGLVLISHWNMQFFHKLLRSSNACWCVGLIFTITHVGVVTVCLV